jgi:hypothetical protein
MLRPWCYWTLGLIGDGETLEQTFNLQTDPFGLVPAANVGEGTLIVPGLSTLVPTSIEIITQPDPPIVATLGQNGDITFTFVSAIPLGEPMTMMGRMTF